MAPKIAPVRRASRHVGRCSAAPLPMAAAKASVDIANAIAAMERGFMREPWREDRNDAAALGGGPEGRRAPMVSTRRDATARPAESLRRLRREGAFRRASAS